jgi:uncharacterized protein (DUF1778 family)
VKWIAVSTILARTAKSRTFKLYQENSPLKPQEHNRTSRIEARIAPEALARRAAEIQGRSIGDFVVAAQDAARKTVAEAEVIRLSREAQEQFVLMLLNPPPPSDALLRTLERHQTLIVE